MTRTSILVAAALALALVLPASATAPQAVIGNPAPAFELTDTDGVTHKLSDYRGKTVVLEWFNPDCPFVVYAHGKKGPLSAQPARVLGEDTVWLAINSGAPGKQGHGLERNKKARDEYGMTYPVLLDEAGSVGRTYGAKTTPHMYVVNAEGTLVYAGGLDDSPMGRKKAETNYVDACLTDLAGGQAVTTSTTKPYGCSVKY